MGQAIGRCPEKESLFKAYIQLELQLGEVEWEGTEKGGKEGGRKKERVTPYGRLGWRGESMIKRRGS